MAKSLYIFRLNGGYVGGATGVVAESPAEAASLIRATASIHYTQKGHICCSDRVFEITPSTLPEDEDCWVLLDVFAIAEDRPCGIAFSEWCS